MSDGPVSGKLAGEALAAALAGLDGWTKAEGRDAIVKTWTFGDFNEAFVGGHAAKAESCRF